MTVELVPRIGIAEVRKAFGNRIPAGPLVLGGVRVEIVSGPQGERRFRCRGCGRDVVFLHLPALTCRRCCGYRHLSWHRSPFSDVSRVQRWRRRLPRNRSGLKTRLERRIAELEAKVLVSVREFLECTERQMTGER